MSFEISERIIAVDSEVLEVLFPQLLSKYGEALLDKPRNIITIGGHWDDVQKTKIRAASLIDGTITPQPLTDGRVAFRCLWQSDLVKDFEDGKITGVEELTQEQLTALTPNPEEP
jgi:hypothetical protein